MHASKKEGTAPLSGGAMPSLWEELPCPSAWAQHLVLITRRPAIAPGEWPIDCYAGRLLAGLDERLSFLQIPSTQEKLL